MSHCDVLPKLHVGGEWETYKSWPYIADRNPAIYLLGECKAFVGERNERKRQGRLRLRVARGRIRLRVARGSGPAGRMRTDRGRLMHTYIYTNKIAIEFTSTGSLRSPNKWTGPYTQHPPY